MERAKAIFKIFNKNSKISPFTLIIRAARDWSTSKNVKSKKICNLSFFYQIQEENLFNEMKGVKVDL